MYIYVFKSHHRPGEMFLTGIIVVIATTIGRAQMLVNEHLTNQDWKPILLFQSFDIPWEVVSDRTKIAFTLVKRYTVNATQSQVIICEGEIFNYDGDYLHA